MKKLLFLAAVPLVGCLTGSDGGFDEKSEPPPIRYAVQTDTPEECLRKTLMIVTEYRKNPRRIEDFEFIYPPPEEVEKLSNKSDAFSPEWRAVGCLTHFDIQIPEPSLMRFLLKANWDLSYPIICKLWGQKSLGADARRILAPRVESMAGRMSDVMVEDFFCRPQTPDDVIEHAIAHPKMSPKTRWRLQEYLSRRSKQP